MIISGDTRLLQVGQEQMNQISYPKIFYTSNNGLLKNNNQQRAVNNNLCSNNGWNHKKTISRKLDIKLSRLPDHVGC